MQRPILLYFLQAFSFVHNNFREKYKNKHFYCYSIFLYISTWSKYILGWCGWSTYWYTSDCARIDSFISLSLQTLRQSCPVSQLEFIYWFHASNIINTRTPWVRKANHKKQCHVIYTSIIQIKWSLICLNLSLKGRSLFNLSVMRRKGNYCQRRASRRVHAKPPKEITSYPTEDPTENLQEVQSYIWIKS